MRFRMTPLTKVLPALLILAMAANAEAQTSPQSGFSANVERHNNAPTSRYRFVPTTKKNAEALADWQDVEPSPQIGRATCLVPAKDPSTSPLRLNPAVDSSAFKPPTAI